MVEFWGIFVVFSACTAFQLTESRSHYAYNPAGVSVSDLSASDQEHDISNSIERWSDFPKHLIADSLESNSLDTSEEAETEPPKTIEQSKEKSETTTQVPKLKKPTPTKRLSLNRRRQRLFEVARDGMREYEKHYVLQTREAIKNIVVELEAVPVKSDNVKEKLTEIKRALKEIEDVDLDGGDSTEFEALSEASDIVSDLNVELDNPVDAPPELEQVLEKVGWLEMRYQLGDEMLSLVERFGKEFKIFIASLTPWERLMEAGLVELHRRFSKGDTDAKWNSFTEFWTYFSI